MSNQRQYSWKNKCLYCGNNPTNHTISYITQSIQSVAMPLYLFTDFLMKPKLLTFVHNTLVTWWMGILHTIGFIKFHSDSSKACGGRSKVIWEEAQRRGIVMQQMCIARKPIEQYRAHQKGRWQYFTSIPIPLDADRRAYVWMDSKSLLKEFYIKKGVPVPNGGSATTLRAGLAIFNRIQKPVIVKPESGSRGRHSLTNLTTEAQFIHAFKIAQQLCYSVVVEEHLIGSVYRATYVGTEVVGILRGDPPRIIGDGTTPISVLIEKKNATKPERVSDVIVTKALHEFIQKQGYTVNSILEQGKTIDLIEKVGLSYGGDSFEETPITHPKLMAELKKAGDALAVPIVGFDFISEDITKDPDTVRWGIIEANSMPFIDLHHFPRVGSPVNVAEKVWDLWK